MKHVLTIAGSDPSGGAGIQADLKTMSALGTYAMSAIVAVTVQNTQKVYDVQEVSPDIVGGQIDVIFEDIPVDAVKVGMVSSVALIRTVRKHLLENGATNVVVDPVMVSKSGYPLLREDAQQEIKTLAAVAHIITPNIPEAELLAEMSIQTKEDMLLAAKKIHALGATYVLIKGGHMEGDANDLLYGSNTCEWFLQERIPSRNTHGTGCTLSSAIACYLAKGYTEAESVRRAKAYVTQAIVDGLDIGKGVGPLGHFVQLYRDAHLNTEDISNG